MISFCEPQVFVSREDGRIRIIVGPCTRRRISLDFGMGKLVLERAGSGLERELGARRENAPRVDPVRVNDFSALSRRSAVGPAYFIRRHVEAGGLLRDR